MCRANRITENKTSSNIYLWCKEKKADIILNYIFENTNEFIKDKVFIYNTKNKIIEKHKIVKINNYDSVQNFNINNENDKIIKLQDFIKQFSKVPENFINDFFVIIKEYPNNKIIIDFEIVVKLLNVRKDSLKKILVDNFKEMFDYKIEKRKKKQINSRGATIYEYILITPNCFKELCIFSNTSKAKIIRKNYIKLEINNFKI
jgi:hypothetical protein